MSIHNIGVVETQRNIERERRKLEGLAARRQVRGARLLDTGAMKYNNDTTTLRAQRRAKRQSDWAAKKTAEREAAYEKAMNAECDRHARVMHIKKMKQKIQLEEYWKMQHRARASTNPEFDLNDPKAKNKDRPARVGDNDPRCGVSSLQMFEGEDLGKQKREQQQMTSLLAARSSQIDAFNARKAKERQDKRAYADFVADTTRIRTMNAIAKGRQKAQRDWNYRQINKGMARSVREEQNRVRAEADALEQLESKLTLSNMRLAEDVSVAGKSELSATRVRTDHFKGFSDEHRKTFYAENDRQVLEKQAALAAEKAREAGYAAHVKNMNEIARRQAAARAVAQREGEVRLKAERKYHSRQHRARERADQDRIMSQKVTDQFLGKFGHLQQ